MTGHHHSAIYDRVWFITGASSDLGRALAAAVLARGELAVVTDRSPENLRHLIEQYPAQALILELDVTQRNQVRSAVGQAFERFGCVDILVNNDGPSEWLAAELAPLRAKLIVVEPDGVTGPKLGVPTTEAEAIIAAVDGVAEGEPLPQRYRHGADRRWDVASVEPRDDAGETTHRARTPGG